mgnify:FL=1
MARMKRLSVENGQRLNISCLPNFHKSGNVKGMKKLFYGENALLVKCGDFIYNCTAEPDIYELAK